MVRRESERALREMVRRWQALPPERRTQFYENGSRPAARRFDRPPLLTRDFVADSSSDGARQMLSAKAQARCRSRP